VVKDVRFPLEVFYDGACLVCASKMERYKKKNSGEKLRIIDISAVDFKAEKLGQRQEQLMEKLHVRDGDGRVYTDVDALAALWRAFPSRAVYRLLAALVSAPGLRQMAKGVYFLFARNRHLLPKKGRSESNACDAGG